MNAVFSELVTYLIKYLVFAVLAVAGILVGGHIRKKKDMELEAEENASEDVQD